MLNTTERYSAKLAVFHVNSSDYTDHLMGLNQRNQKVLGFISMVTRHYFNL